MFEVNLMPGGQRGGGGGRSGGIGGPRHGPSGLRLRGLLDRWILGSLLILLGSLGISAHLIIGASERVVRLEAALGEALRDSAAAAERAQAQLRLEGMRDSIAARVAAIEEIDARRYAWPHLLDEIALAVPDGLWITRIVQVPSERPGIRFRVEGRAPERRTLSRYWNTLESSLFIGDVELLSAEQSAGWNGGGRDETAVPYHFVLEAHDEDPPPGILDWFNLAGSGT